MEYRTNFLLNIFGGFFTLVIQLYLWSSIFENTSSKTVFGYTYSELIIYTVMAALVTNLVSTGFERDIALDIKDGGLSKFLIQPINYFKFRSSCFLGQKCSELLVTIILSVFLLCTINSVMDLDLNIINIFFSIIPILLSILLNFLFFYCISSLAFWFEEVSMLFWGVNLLTLIISGSIFPLDIFGERLNYALNFLPFKYTVYFPINIITGRLSPSMILNGVLIQLVWIVIHFFLLKALWKIGMNKYLAVGG
ncbi:MULTISPECIES: ABC transporter permease [Bacillus]|nr:ABC-2 family transporter protein [Bacillus subtilis]KAA0937846.1 ABC transporter permease [Bacillus sp. ANT_WA51]MBU8842179.1 ABC-2 family transporter protein [Alkalicoccobacillus gibsonii]NDK00435.1 ABC-type transport system, permease [Bacillus subtilis subsp. subtilis]HCJ7961474.1 ABC-2 family transporter protein [Klebsiella pneumoniae]MBT2169439.1 ABC-2 family transporter protein [Bacillus subtilis]